MARLREQRRMVKALNDFFKNTGYTDPSSRRVRLGNIAKDAIPEKDFSGYIATRMTLRDRVIGLIRPKYFKREKYILDRAHKNNRLYKSCIEDGFIENVYENVNVPGGEPIPVFQGIRVSNKGGDLIHCVGFIEAYLNKYPTQKLIVYTIIGTLFSTAVLGAIITKILNFW